MEEVLCEGSFEGCKGVHECWRRVKTTLDRKQYLKVKPVRVGRAGGE
jgi:hypothetical protein